VHHRLDAAAARNVNAAAILDTPDAALAVATEGLLALIDEDRQVGTERYTCALQGRKQLGLRERVGHGDLDEAGVPLDLYEQRL
jgi:hypothetical protein